MWGSVGQCGAVWGSERWAVEVGGRVGAGSIIRQWKRSRLAKQRVGGGGGACVRSQLHKESLKRKSMVAPNFFFRRSAPEESL